MLENLGEADLGGGVTGPECRHGGGTYTLFSVINGRQKRHEHEATTRLSAVKSVDVAPCVGACVCGT
jgi:hypothetical protein